MLTPTAPIFNNYDAICRRSVIFSLTKAATGLGLASLLPKLFLNQATPLLSRKSLIPIVSYCILSSTAQVFFTHVGISLTSDSIKSSLKSAETSIYHLTVQHLSMKSIAQILPFIPVVAVMAMVAYAAIPAILAFGAAMAITVTLAFSSIISNIGLFALQLNLQWDHVILIEVAHIATATLGLSLISTDKEATE